MGFYPYNFNEQKNKTWKLLIITIANPNPPPRFLLLTHFLGYDFDKKTEKFLSSGLVISTSSVSWSPNNEDIAVFTTTGLEIVRVDGSSSNILEYDLDTGTMSRLYHSWIPRRD